MLYEGMLIGIGFLSACLCMAVLAPVIHGRAVRLTARRLLGGLPRSMVEMRAQKDQLRAEFAMQIRRLEMTIAEMQAKTAGNSGEVARKAAEIDRLRGDLRKAQVAVLQFQARELMRRSTVRTVVKLLVYLYDRSGRPKFGRPGQAREAGAPTRACPTWSSKEVAEVGYTRLRLPGPIRRVLSIVHGVWVPAFAGTTAENAGRPSADMRGLTSP